MGLEGLNLEDSIYKRKEVALDVQNHGFLGLQIKGQSLICQEVSDKHNDFVGRQPGGRHSVPCLEYARSLNTYQNFI